MEDAIIIGVVVAAGGQGERVLLAKQTLGLPTGTEWVTCSACISQTEYLLSTVWNSKATQEHSAAQAARQDSSVLPHTPTCGRWYVPAPPLAVRHAPLERPPGATHRSVGGATAGVAEAVGEQSPHSIGHSTTPTCWHAAASEKPRVSMSQRMREKQAEPPASRCCTAGVHEITPHAPSVRHACSRHERRSSMLCPQSMHHCRRRAHGSSLRSSTP